MLSCPLRFPHNTMFDSSLHLVVYGERGGGGGGLCLNYVICVCLRIVLSNTCCVVFLICFSSSCISYVASFSGLSIFDCPFGTL